MNNFSKIGNGLRALMVKPDMNRGVRLIDVMPRVITEESYSSGMLLDGAIVQAARVSYGEGTKKSNTDKGLIKYLLAHKHTTPFEMVEFKFHIKTPIFVARQWFRHRTGSFNEISARYSVLPHEMYEPTGIREQGAPGLVSRQSSGALLEADDTRKKWNSYSHLQSELYGNYIELIHEHGVARELARIGLPQNMYTEFYWKVNLHNLLHFIRLRSHATAQDEIREYAEEISDIVKDLCPVTSEAFEEHILGSMTLSKTEIESIRNSENSLIGGSKRTNKEYLEKLKVLGLEQNYKQDSSRGPRPTRRPKTEN